MRQGGWSGIRAEVQVQADMPEVVATFQGVALQLGLAGCARPDVHAAVLQPGIQACDRQHAQFRTIAGLFQQALGEGQQAALGTTLAVFIAVGREVVKADANHRAGVLRGAGQGRPGQAAQQK